VVEWRDTPAVGGEPGRFPTIYLRLLLSQRAGKPGDRLSLRVEGTDADSFGRGKVLSIEEQRGDEWLPVGLVVGARSREGRSRWVPPDAGPLAVTLEGYRATRPLYFVVPPVPAGDYRIRLDLIHSRGEVGDLRDRTATLYAPLRILESH
jgi:hypothetical protein